jgi:hypothetical protein
MQTPQGIKGLTVRGTTLRRRLFTLLGFPVAAAAGLGIASPLAASAASTSSSQVAYVTDASNGGNSLWVDGLGLVAPADGATYATHTPAAALTVTIHNIAMTSLDVPSSTALSGMDTVVMFATCDIGQHPNAMKAINAFFEGGGKLIILDGAQCTEGLGGTPDYTTFSKPFVTNYKLPVPQYGTLPYTYVESSTLTTGLPDCGVAPCNEPGNAVADASALSASSDGWCKDLGGTSTNAVKGPVGAYAHSKSGTGLALYNGEAFAWSFGSAAQYKHARLVFDDLLAQPWKVDGLNCTSPLKSLVLTPPSDNPFTGVTETLTATVTDGLSTPVAGQVVTFNVLTGPKAGATGQGTTNASGVATFAYTSPTAGTDVVKASFSDADDHLSTPTSVAWQAAPPPSIAETHSAILVPVIGFLLVGGSMVLTVVRRRRRSVTQAN